MNNKKTSFGFTLIELLMVISIITLISSIFFSYVGSAKAKSRDAVRLSDIKQINTAATLFYEDKGILPDSIGVVSGQNPNTSLVGAGYLSAEPKDPKTGMSYKFSKVGNNGKQSIMVAATYESIYTIDNKPQKVGIIVGDIDTSNICILIKDFEYFTGSKVDMDFPTCGTSGVNDQIIGVTSGNRSSSGGIATELPGDNISDCSEGQIDKNCPSLMLGTPCYCKDSNNDFIHNIDISDTSIFTQEKCESLRHGLYWFNDFSVCVDKYTCNSYGSGVWFGNYCRQITEDEGACYDHGGLWDGECYRIINGVRQSFDPYQEDYCYNNNGVWLSDIEVCLTQYNCEQYTQAPYHKYWSGSICAEADDRSVFLNQEGCENRSGTWITYGSDYQCNINMTQGQCSASGGDIWAGNVCKFSSTGSNIEPLD